MCNQRTTPGWLGWCYLYLSKSKTGSLLIISAPTYPGCLWHNVMHFSHSIKNWVEIHRRQHHSILILLVIINKGSLATMLTRATILKCDLNLGLIFCQVLIRSICAYFSAWVMMNKQLLPFLTPRELISVMNLNCFVDQSLVP